MQPLSEESFRDFEKREAQQHSIYSHIVSAVYSILSTFCNKRELDDDDYDSQPQIAYDCNPHLPPPHPPPPLSISFNSPFPKLYGKQQIFQCG